MKKVFLSIAVAAMLVACNNNMSDITKPEILLNSPSDNDTIFACDEHGMHLDMELSDDVALGSYKIDIHSAAGHQHAPSRHGDEAMWTYTHSWDDIQGKKNAHIHHHEIIVPETVEHGVYHFMVYCTDEAGNESFVVKNVIIAEGNGEHDHDHE